MVKVSQLLIGLEARMIVDDARDRDRSAPPNDAQRVAQGGFFTPYDGAFDSVERPYDGLRPYFARAEPAFLASVTALAAYGPELQRIASGASGLVGSRPARFTQEWFPRLDAAMAYGMVRQSRPRRIIEIGSGHSTRFLAQAIADGGLGTDLVCIDPQPRAPLQGLGLRHIERAFEADDAALAATLEADDILFIDSSHVAIPGSEVDRVVLDILPRLRRGVLVHFHDIFLPDGYPAAWVRRAYNEQLVVGALLQGSAYSMLAANHHMAAHTTMLAGSVVEHLPLLPGAFEGSLWLRKEG